MKKVTEKGILFFFTVLSLISTLYSEDFSGGSVSFAEETPHIKWAKPYCKGKLKLFFIIPITATRDVVELNQRLDADIQVLPVSARPGKFGSSEDPQKEQWGEFPCSADDSIFQMFVEKFKEVPDVFVICGTEWKIIPTEIRSRIIEKIRAGMPLVYFTDKKIPDDLSGEYMECQIMSHIKGVPYTALPYFKKYKSDSDIEKAVFDLRKLKNGLILKINYGEIKDLSRISLCPETMLNPANIPVNGASDLNYEYYQSFLIKVLLWLSGKAADSGIEKITISQAVSKFHEPVSIDINLMKNIPKLEDLRIAFAVRSERNNMECRKTVKIGDVKFDGVKYSFSLPVLRRGKYFCDTWLLDHNGKIIDWASCPFFVESDLFFTGINLGKKGYDPEDEISGRISLNKAPCDKAEFVISLEDNLGRVIEKKIEKAQSQNLSFSFRLKSPVVVLHRVKAVLRIEGEIADEKETGFPVKIQNRDEYQFIVWRLTWGWDTGKKGYTTYSDYILNYNLYNKYGVDAVLTAGRPWDIYGNTERFGLLSLLLAKNNLLSIPYTTRLFSTNKKTENLIMKPCFSSPAWKNSINEELSKICNACSKYAPLAYSLGDEPAIWGYNQNDFCFCDFCMRGFREYLKEEYCSLDILNREWNTSFNNWDMVRPLTYKEAKESGNYAAWVEHRRFMEKVFADAADNCIKTLKANDCAARVGVDGLLSGKRSFLGIDDSVFFKNMHYCAPYVRVKNDVQKEIISSFIAKGCLFGGIYGYGPMGYRQDEAYHRSIPWDYLFHKANSMLLYSAERLNAVWPLFKGDMAPFPNWNWAVDEISEIKNGIGKLLMCAEKEDPEVAMFYSPVSVHVRTITDTPSSNQSFTDIIQNIGLERKWISSDFLKNGFLTDRNFKVLVLPTVLALSESEAKAIKTFAEQGGMVIADFKSGIADEHGKLQRCGILDDFWGIKRHGNILSTVKNKQKPYSDLILDSDVSALPGSLVLNTADKDIPLGIIRYHGKGMSVYLNALTVNGVTELSPLIQQIFQIYGKVTNPLNVIMPDGRRIFPEAAFFRNGVLRYAGVLGVSGGEKIYFPCKSHIYDVRNKKYHGYTDQITVESSSSEAKLYALFPYKVEKMTVNANSHISAGSDFLYRSELSVSNGVPGLHVIRLEVRDPSGVISRCYSKNILAIAGKCDGYIPFAINDMPGTWTLEFIDVVSGIKEMRQLTVDGPNY